MIGPTSPVTSPSPAVLVRRCTGCSPWMCSPSDSNLPGHLCSANYPVSVHAIRLFPSWLPAIQGVLRMPPIPISREHQRRGHLALQGAWWQWRGAAGSPALSRQLHSTAATQTPATTSCLTHSVGAESYLVPGATACSEVSISLGIALEEAQGAGYVTGWGLFC